MTNVDAKYMLGRSASILWLLCFQLSLPAGASGSTSAASFIPPQPNSTQSNVTQSDQALLTQPNLTIPEYFELGRQTDVEIATTWKGTQQIGEVVHPLGQPTRHVHLVRDLLHSNETQALMDAIRLSTPSMGLSKQPDSVDSMPSFEMYFIQNGREVHRIAKDVRPLIKQRITPYIRKQYNCSKCMVCTALLRRYLPGERRGHDSHFDSQAYVTGIATLNPNDHVGGFYLQPGEHVSSRKYMPLRSRDVLFHQYDLNHGVHVEEGSRYSVIFWASNSQDSCRKGISSWYASDAQKGKPDAQYNLGELYAEGRQGFKQDERRALLWWTKAAKQGMARAQQRLGLWFLIHGQHAEPDNPLGIDWTIRAAEQGHREAQSNLGLAYKDGIGIPADAGLAVKWFTKAAEQGDPDAQVGLGLMFREGNGVLRNDVTARAWFEKAARQGDTNAQEWLAQMYKVGGNGIKPDEALSNAWLETSTKDS